MQCQPVAYAHWQQEQVDAWAAELSQTKRIRTAVNQDMASDDMPVNDGDEIAFFPPVTGG